MTTLNKSHHHAAADLQAAENTRRAKLLATLPGDIANNLLATAPDCMEFEPLPEE